MILRRSHSDQIPHSPTRNNQSRWGQEKRPGRPQLAGSLQEERTIAGQLCRQASGRQACREGIKRRAHSAIRDPLALNVWTIARQEMPWQVCRRRNGVVVIPPEIVKKCEIQGGNFVCPFPNPKKSRRMKMKIAVSNETFSMIIYFSDQSLAVREWRYSDYVSQHMQLQVYSNARGTRLFRTNAIR